MFSTKGDGEWSWETESWNNTTREIVIHASALTPSLSPKASAPWAKQGTKYFDLRSFRFIVVTTGAVTIDIQRIYSAEWPDGVVVPIFEASYQSAIAQAIQKMTPRGCNFGSSLHTMTAANEDPTPDTLKAVQAAGGDLFFHHHGVTLDTARLPVSMDGRHTANQIRRYFAEQLEYLRVQGYREIPRSKFGLQFQMGMFHMPTSSPQMTRMFGRAACCATASVETMASAKAPPAMAVSTAVSPMLCGFELTIKWPVPNDCPFDDNSG